jgi:type II secretory pathway component PulC
LKIYRQLQGERSASFEVVRDGKARVVEVQLDGRRGRG